MVSTPLKSITLCYSLLGSLGTGGRPRGPVFLRCVSWSLRPATGLNLLLRRPVAQAGERSPHRWCQFGNKAQHLGLDVYLSKSIILFSERVLCKNDVIVTIQEFNILSQTLTHTSGCTGDHKLLHIPQVALETTYLDGVLTLQQFNGANHHFLYSALEYWKTQSGSHIKPFQSKTQT